MFLRALYAVAGRSLAAGSGCFRRARFAGPDPSVTGCAGVVTLAELVDLLGVVGHLDAGIGALHKSRDRGVSRRQLLVALGQAQLAGADYLSGMDTHRRDVGVTHLGANVSVAFRAGPALPGVCV